MCKSPCDLYLHKPVTRISGWVWHDITMTISIFCSHTLCFCWALSWVGAFAVLHCASLTCFASLSTLARCNEPGLNFGFENFYSSLLEDAVFIPLCCAEESIKDETVWSADWMIIHMYVVTSDHGYISYQHTKHTYYHLPGTRGFTPTSNRGYRIGTSTNAPFQRHVTGLQPTGDPERMSKLRTAGIRYMGNRRLNWQGLCVGEDTLAPWSQQHHDACVPLIKHVAATSMCIQSANLRLRPTLLLHMYTVWSVGPEHFLFRMAKNNDSNITATST